MPALGLNAAHGAESWSTVLIEALSQESADLRGGIPALPVDGKVVHLPRILIDPAADWTAELAELPSDAGSGDALALQPRKGGADDHGKK
jgi:hypothetical protein